MKVNSNSVRVRKNAGAIVTQHPVEIIEPDASDDDVKAALEAFNTVAQWMLEDHDLWQIGRRAVCIHACAARGRFPRRGLFRSVENDRIEQMLKLVLVTVLGVLVDRSDFRLTGRKTVALVHLIKKEIKGARSLGEVGEFLGCKKQAVSQSQKRLVKKLNAQLATKYGSVREGTRARLVL